MEETGSISGTVIDTEGEPLPGVVVSAMGVLGMRTAVTNAMGRYRILDLQPGNYTLTAELEGFSTVKILDVFVRMGQDTEVNITMQPAVVEE